MPLTMFYHKITNWIVKLKFQSNLSSVKEKKRFERKISNSLDKHQFCNEREIRLSLCLTSTIKINILISFFVTLFSFSDALLSVFYSSYSWLLTLTGIFTHTHPHTCSYT